MQPIFFFNVKETEKDTKKMYIDGPITSKIVKIKPKIYFSSSPKYNQYFIVLEKRIINIEKPLAISMLLKFTVKKSPSLMKN